MIRSAGSLLFAAAAARAAANCAHARAGSPRTGRLAAGAPIALLLVLTAWPLFAQSVAATANGSIVAAHDGVVDLYAPDAKTRLWRADGVPYSGPITVGGKDVAILDPIDNLAVIVDIETGTARPIHTGETPIAAAFVGRDLYVLDRDARTVERITRDGGARATVAVAADPAFLRESIGKIYVYSRTAGALQEITLTPFAVSRSTPVPPFASDLVIDRSTAYLVYPTGQRHFDMSQIRSGSSRNRMTSSGGIVAVALASMQTTDQTATGSVPVGLALIPRSNPASAVVIAIADPAGQRVLMIEGEVSPTQAFARGFVKGLLGISSAPAKEVPFESGVDRVAVGGGSRIAYDSSSGTLYSFSQKKVRVLANGVGPNGFTAIPGGAAWWAGGTLVAQKENR